MTEEQIKQIRDEYFPHLDPDLAYLNHGSFGSAPKPIREACLKFSEEWSAKADIVYYTLLKDHYMNSLKAVAPVVNCPEPFDEHLALIDNATTGANIIVQSVAHKFIIGEYKCGDAVIMFDSVYQAVRLTVQHFLTPVGCKIKEARTPFPLWDLSFEEANNAICNSLEATIQQCVDNNITIRTFILEHIPSEYTMLFPLKRLVAICRILAPDAIVFVDGAHAIGNVPLDFQDLHVDFYVTNLHKWFFALSPCCLFYCKSKFNDSGKGANLDLHHPVISWGYGKGLSEECVWTGTRDNSSKLILADALKFYPKIARKLFLLSEEAHGDNFDKALTEIQSYNHARTRQYACMLAESWGTYVATPLKMVTSMALIALPESIGITTDEAALKLRLYMVKHYKVICFPCALPCTGSTSSKNCHKDEVTHKGFLRLSHQVYVSHLDVKRLEEAILDVINNSEATDKA